jgi:hypothetical protein
MEIHSVVWKDFFVFAFVGSLYTRAIGPQRQ